MPRIRGPATSRFLGRCSTTTNITRGSYTTRGDRETRTLNLRKGTYRVKVQAKYGYRGTTSTAVQLRA